MADGVLARATVVVEGDIDPNIGTDVAKAFDKVDDAIEDAAKALAKVQQAADDARATTGRALGELSESSQQTKDGFGDLSSAASAVGAGLAGAGLVSEQTAAKFTAFADISGGLEGAFTAVQGAGSLVAGSMSKLQGVMTKTALGQKVMTAATKAMTLAQRALNAVLRANPLGLIITAITILVGALVLAYKRSETFRNIVNKAFNAVKTVAMGVFNAIKNAVQIFWKFATAQFRVGMAILQKIWPPIQRAAGAVFDRIKGFVSGLINAVKGAAGKIGGFFKGMWDGITGAARSALNGVIGIINGLINGVNKLINGLNKIPGANVPTIPNIPKLATGASRFAGGPAIINDRGPETVILPGGARVLTAQQTKRANAEARGDVTINVNEYGPRSGAARVREADWLYRFGPRTGLAQ